MKERRDFLKALAGLTTGILLPSGSLRASQAASSDAIGKVLPQRLLGRTGVPVTSLGLGGFHVGWTTGERAQAVIEKALESGIRFFDTAESYGPATSEERYGQYLPKEHRDLLFIMTKTTARDAATAKRHLQESLDRLRTDYIDLWQIHAISDPVDVRNRIDQGVLEVVREAKAKGRVRHIGFTGHANPQAHLEMLKLTRESDCLEVCQMPINPVDAACSESFTREVLPLLMERNMGVLAMKTLADGRFFAAKNEHSWRTADPVVPGRMSLQEALFFVWSLPVSVLITGAENVEFLEDKVRLARAYASFAETERQRLIEAVADLAEEGKVEYYKKV